MGDVAIAIGIWAHDVLMGALALARTILAGNG